jgi:hypothetical protein
MLRDGQRESKGANREQWNPRERMLEVVRYLGEEDLREVERLVLLSLSGCQGEKGKKKTDKNRTRVAAAPDVSDSSLLNLLLPSPSRRATRDSRQGNEVS